MKSYRFSILLIAVMVFLWVGSDVSKADGLVAFEAESGALGSDWTVINGNPTYITITTDDSGNAPSNSMRVATYTITFPTAGTYQLYARVLVGPGGFNDDSLFYADSFGGQSSTVASDWVLVNGLNDAGFSNSTDLVTGGGSLANGMWKWINLSQFTSEAGFTVSAGNLIQTFQIGARENGLDVDKFVFGTAGTSFTVSNLDTETLPAPPPTITITNYFPGPDGMTIHRFNPLYQSLNLDGANPASGLLLSGNILCGTTLNGGLQGAGTAFYMSLDGTSFNAFRSFTNTPDAGNPQGDLAASGSGFLGTTFGGGSNGTGAAFGVQTNGAGFLVCSFAAVNADNATNLTGAGPSASAIPIGGKLYGTTIAGGAFANGTVFSVSTNGGSLPSALHRFTELDSPTGTNTDGATPWGSLVLSGNTLFGTTSAGGSGGNGTVFSVDISGNNFTTLYNFTALDPVKCTNSDGAIPCGGLVLTNGTLYGTTTVGGFENGGTIFSIGTNGIGFTVLHQFTGLDEIAGTNIDGAKPEAALLLSSNLLYGTTSAGGAGGSGVVFSVNTNGADFKTLYSFTSVDALTGTNTDGAHPVAGLLLVGNSLIGTTFGGGPGAEGTVFSLPLPLPPALITNLVQNVDGTLTLSFLGSPNSTNVIQATTNLTSPVNWQNISTNVADSGGAWRFTGTNQFPAQFYRSYSR